MEQLGLRCTCYEQVQQGACVLAASDRTWPGCTNRKVFVYTYVFSFFNAHEAPHMLWYRGTYTHVQTHIRFKHTHTCGVSPGDGVNPGGKGFKGGLFGIHTCCIHYRPSIWMIQSITSAP